jgi:hypothetical protein
MRSMAALALVLLAQDGLDPALGRTADAVRATAEELKYRELPWVTDVFEGFRLAKEEKRPVFLYMVVGDPLEDC